MSDDLFDYGESQRRKRDGMDRGASNRNEALLRAREVALEITEPGGTATSDLVFAEMERRGLPGCIGPAAGSLFKTCFWEFTGRRVRSTRKRNHARELKVWKRVL